MAISVNAKSIARVAREEAVRRLRAHNFGAVLQSQAIRRMDAGGDSQHKYPELWANRHDGYRAGGQPLLDKGLMRAEIHGVQQNRSDGLRVKLIGPLVAIYHQHGFKTKGPNFIPLTLKAARTHIKGANPETEGLVRGVDFVMAWKGVTVPQRKIFNLPPENVSEIRSEIVTAIQRN